jgi:hypothetical protein
MMTVRQAPQESPDGRWYHILMKLFCAWIMLAATAAFAGVNPQLHEVKRVYILAMSASLDQFLASQLAKAGVFEVVTDPKKADAIITDRVGEPFENKLDELYPPPPPPKPADAKPAADAAKSDSTKGDSAKADSDKGDSTKSDSAKSDSAKGDGKVVVKGDPLSGVDLSGGARPSTMGRGKGNIFIVGRGSRSVLWSIYEPPKNNTPRELTKTAERVVKHLQEDLTGKKPAE